MLRDPIDEPRLIFGCTNAHKPGFIDFVHPGYDGGDDKSHVLLSLRALDDGGIDYATAHTACGILAANRWDGFFSRDRYGTQKVERSEDGVLRDNRYFYHVPPASTDEPYPVLTRFNDWRFPHNALPPLWTRLQRNLSSGVEPERVGINNGHCSLSNYADGVESAHLVPSAQSNWWSRNHMARYGETNLFSTDPINAPANYIPLRSDIHKIFDERHFCLVPKEPRSKKFADQGERVVVLGQSEAESTSREGDKCGTGERENDNIPPNTASQTGPCLVAHVFNSTPSGQLPRLWHNRRVHALPSTVSVECLFVRFAWTVFSPTVFRDFLYATERHRRILVWDPDKSEHEVQEASPERCRAIYTASRSRSESPKKRSRVDIDRQRGEDGRRPKEDEWAGEWSNSDEWDGDSGYQDNIWPPGETSSETKVEDQPRGRTRKRKFSTAWDGLLKLDPDLHR